MGKKFFPLFEEKFHVRGRLKAGCDGNMGGEGGREERKIEPFIVSRLRHYSWQTSGIPGNFSLSSQSFEEFTRRL
jgi:hypothetical protein